MSRWKAVQLRRIARFEYGQSLPDAARREGDVQVYGSNGVVGRHDTANTQGPVIVVGRKGSFGKVQYSTNPVFAIDTTYFIDGRYTTANLRWLFHALQVLQLDKISEDVGVPGLSRGRAYSVKVPYPPEEDQSAIADFLDAEVARIDALMEKKGQMVELLYERRRTLMADGVCGLATSGRRVHSGLPWLDEIPAAWSVAKLTLVAKLGSGHTPSRDHPEWWKNCTIPWITTGEVAQMRDDRIEYVTETRERISYQGMANSAARLHPADTVVLSRTASAGFSAIMGSNMATSQDFVTWTCGPLLKPRFLLLCLRVMRQDLLGRLAMGSTHKTIYMPDIQAIRVPLPPVKDQEAIVEEVWSRLRLIDKTGDALGREVQLLQERREAVITAAVTGQLDLAEAA